VHIDSPPPFLLLLTSTGSYHETHPASLVRLQEKHWFPVIQWANEELKVEVQTFDSVMIGVQPQASKDALRRILFELDQWQLAGT